MFPYKLSRRIKLTLCGVNQQRQTRWNLFWQWLLFLICSFCFEFSWWHRTYFINLCSPLQSCKLHTIVLRVAQVKTAVKLWCCKWIARLCLPLRLVFKLPPWSIVGLLQISCTTCAWIHGSGSRNADSGSRRKVQPASLQLLLSSDNMSARSFLTSLLLLKCHHMPTDVNWEGFAQWINIRKSSWKNRCDTWWASSPWPPPHLHVCLNLSVICKGQHTRTHTLLPPSFA